MDLPCLYDISKEIVLAGITSFPAIGVHLYYLNDPSVLIIVVLPPARKPIMVGFVKLGNRPEYFMFQESFDVKHLPVGKEAASSGTNA